MVDNEIASVNGSPYHVGPTRAMPNAADKHGNEEVEVTSETTDPITAERDIDIIAHSGNVSSKQINDLLQKVEAIVRVASEGKR